jgi:predicted PurR-regulated permease PerM
VGREQLFAAFFFAVFLFLIYQLFVFLQPFLTPLLWAAILSLTFYPLTAWLVRLCRGSRNLAAFLLVVVITAGAILPSVYLGTMLVREAGEAYQRVQEMSRSGELAAVVEDARGSRAGLLWRRLTGPFQGRIDIDPASLVVTATRWTSQQIAGGTALLERNVLLTLVNFLLMLVALFFFFRDGERIARQFGDLIPMAPAHKQRVFRRLYDTLSAVVQSMVIVAIVQGVLAGLGYWVIGRLPFSLFLAFLTGVMSFVPMAGATIVWLSTSIYLLVIGETARGIGLVLWGALFVSSVDNFIKPLFIGGRAKLPTLLLLFSILGGLQAYGFMGIFLAPVVLALLLAFVDIYRELYHTAPATVVDGADD